MKTIAVILILVIPVFNIAFNMNLKEAANRSGSFGKALLSKQFLFSVLIGTGTMLGLLLFYLSGIDLARGFLLIGAFSIVGGTLFGVFFYKEKLLLIEWLLISVIGVLMLYRFFLKNS